MNMSELFDKSIHTLELPRVLQLLSDQAVSTEAKEKALRIRPETETEEVLRLLDQTDAARAMIGLHGAPSFSGVKPVGEALDRADRGGSLNTKELLTIADLLTAARRAKEYFNADAMEKTAIDHLFLSLHGNRFLEGESKGYNGAYSVVKASHAWRNWQFSLSWANPLNNNYKAYENELLNRNLYKHTIGYSKWMGNLVSLNISWRLSRGSKHNSAEKRINLRDTDNGIIK